MADVVFVLIILAFFALRSRTRASRRVSRTSHELGLLINGVVAFALLVYLFYALIRPEKF